MRLISVLLGFAMKKVGALVVLVLSLFLGYLLIQTLVPSLREAVEERDRLRQVSQERAALEDNLEELRVAAEEGRSEAVASLDDAVSAEIAAGRVAVADKQADVERLRDDQEDICDFTQDVIDFVTPGSACESAERAVAAADEALDTLEGGLSQAEDDAEILGDPDLTAQEKLDRLNVGGDDSLVERQINNQESELSLKKAEEDSLEKAQASGVGWVIDRWAQSWKWLAGIALVVLVLPSLLRVVSYFLLMPMVRRAHKPIHLAAGHENPAADLHASDAHRTLTVHLDVDEVLTARSEHVRPVQGTVRSRPLYQWRSPFISFAAGLYNLSRITGVEGGSTATLATPDDPNSYLMRIDFNEHPGLVMHPKHVVGVIGDPSLSTRWRWGIQSFATWQVRYIIFSGAGSLIVQGSGDIQAQHPGGKSLRIDQNLVMGFDTRLRAGVDRTEVFWSYWRGKTPLVDDKFTGDHLFFWQKSTTDGSSNPITRTFNSFFSAFGKLLGF